MSENFFKYCSFFSTIFFSEFFTEISSFMGVDSLLNQNYSISMDFFQILCFVKSL